MAEAHPLRSPRRCPRRAPRDMFCSQCPTKLAEWDGTRITLKYKKLTCHHRDSFSPLEVVCRNCGTVNKLRRPDPGP